MLIRKAYCFQSNIQIWPSYSGNLSKRRIFFGMQIIYLMEKLFDNCFLLFFIRKPCLCDQLPIYVRNSIPYKHRPDLLTENIESSWVEVNRLKSKKLVVGRVEVNPIKSKTLVVGRVYRPPNACSDTFIDLLNDSFSKLPVGSEIVLLGDFNIDFLAQKNGASFKLKRQQRQFAIVNGLEQLINSPTRIFEQTRTAIDLVFVNNTHRVVESGVIHSAISDHSFVYCTMKSGVPKHLSQLNTVRIAITIRVLLVRT